MLKHQGSRLKTIKWAARVQQKERQCVKGDKTKRTGKTRRCSERRKDCRDMSVSAAGETLQRGRGRMPSISTHHTVGSAEAFSEESTKTCFCSGRILSQRRVGEAWQTSALTNIIGEGVAENGEEVWKTHGLKKQMKGKVCINEGRSIANADASIQGTEEPWIVWEFFCFLFLAATENVYNNKTS